jgi:isopenicillin N synthase-like dioxygenase
MIPVIDISDAVAGAPGDSTVDAIRTAIQEVGFFQIVGHGVPPETIRAVYAACDVLMNLPAEVKEQWTHPHPFRGWERRPAAGPETGQRLQVCGIGSPEEAVARGIAPERADYFQTNVWPDVPDLREAIDALMAEQKRVGETLMSLFALALDLEADHFAPCFVNQVSTFAINYYRGGVRTGDRELALREHKDSGTLTVLHQRGEYEGLQVRMPDDTLVGIPVRDDAFVINVGELMERWTNDRFKATLHRVLLPEAAGAMRTSLTLFQGPAIDTVIAPLPGCVGDDGPHYDPVTPYDWEARYFAQNGLAIGVPYGATA